MGQGDPFSPAILALLASAIIPMLQKLHVGLHVTDDLIVYLSCSPEEAIAVVAATVHCLREFGVYIRLRMNVGKSKIILKGMRQQEDVECLELSVASKVAYLGVMITDVSPSDINAKAIATSFVRA